MTNQLIDQFILANLPGTFAQLHGKATQHFGTDTYRKVDQRLQALRRRDLIAFHREGRDTIWSVKA